MTQSQPQIDPRAWLIWGGAAALPALIGRNPFPLLAALLAVIAVRLAWTGSTSQNAGWAGITRIAVTLAVVSVAFNALTVRAGDRVLLTIPDVVPLLGGPVTLNAVVFGVVSAIALVTLVLIGVTLGVVLDWASVLRLAPERLTGVAVAGTVAFTFIPATLSAFRDLREAYAVRGYRFRGLRDAAPILVALLSGGLERAVMLSETLEARAFGAPATTVAAGPEPDARWTAIGAAFACLAVYLFAVDRLPAALGSSMVAALLLLKVLRAPGHRSGRTTYRPQRWDRADMAIAVGAIVATLALLVARSMNAAYVAYEPYPSLTAPLVSLPLLIGMLGLWAPAVVALTAGSRSTLPA